VPIKGYDPEELYRDQEAFCQKLSIDPSKYQQHHALDDARLVREIYAKIEKSRRVLFS